MLTFNRPVFSATKPQSVHFGSTASASGHFDVSKLQELANRFERKTGQQIEFPVQSSQQVQVSGLKLGETQYRLSFFNPPGKTEGFIPTLNFRINKATGQVEEVFYTSVGRVNFPSVPDNYQPYIRQFEEDFPRLMQLRCTETHLNWATATAS